MRTLLNASWERSRVAEARPAESQMFGEGNGLGMCPRPLREGPPLGRPTTPTEA